MKRLLTALAVAAVALGGFAVGSAAAYIDPYTGSGEWFAPGASRHGQYDWCGGFWYGNNFSRTADRPGVVTFINPSGGWRYTRHGTVRYLYSIIPAGQERFNKKPYCANTSSYWYQGGCWGDRREAYQCA